MATVEEIIRTVYDSTPVHATGRITATGKTLTELSQFQRLVRAAEEMQTKGLIMVLQPHREGYTGQRFIDAISFKRLK
jgi:hypothetical protein